MDLMGLVSGVVNPEVIYNEAKTPDLRAQLIMFESKDIEKKEVARKFAALDYRELKAFQAAGTQPKKGTQFDDHWGRLDKIVKNSPKVAEDMVRQFKSNPGNYAAAMDDLAANFEANPKFAETVLKRLEKNPESAGATFADYSAHFNKRNVQGYIDQTMKGTAGPAGPAPSPAPAKLAREAAQDAAAVVAGATGAEPVKPQAKTPKAGKPGRRDAQMDRSKQLADRDAATPTARAAAPVAAVTEQPDDKATAKTAADATTIDDMSPEDAKREYQRFGADPKNKDFMAMLKQNGLEEDVEGLIAKNPDRVNGLFSPGTMKKYSSLLKDGKKAEFMAEFSGESKKESLNPADLMGSLGGAIDAAALKNPWLGDLKKFVMSGFGGVQDGVYKMAGALQGAGRSLKDMLNEETNEAELRKAGIVPVKTNDEEYLTQVARDAQENLRARKTAPDGPNSVALSRHGMKMLAEDFSLKQPDLQRLLDGSATIAHVDIVEQKNKAGKMEKVAIARLEPFVPQRPGAAVPGAEPVPSAAAKVEATVAIARAQAGMVNEMQPPRPVLSGETTTS